MSDVNRTSDGSPSPPSLDSSAKLSQKVEWIVTTGAGVEILDGSYERDKARRSLQDYIDHPGSTDTVVERAENAIEEIEAIQNGQ